MVYNRLIGIKRGPLADPFKTELQPELAQSWEQAPDGLAYTFKFLWAPLLDRFALPFLGRRRGWMMVIQFALALSIAALALQNPAVSLSAVAVTALVIVFFSASQDIVIDAYRADVSLPQERGLAAAANNLGYRACRFVIGAPAPRRHRAPASARTVVRLRRAPRRAVRSAAGPRSRGP